jgi:flagellar protein FliS
VSTAALRARYLSDAVTTATPARLLVMLYDKLVLDLTQAEEALRAGDRGVASGRLIHAQDIVAELLSSLEAEAWEGGKALSSLYVYITTELAQSNVTADPDRVAACRGHVEPLRDAWRTAAEQVAQSTTLAGVTSGVA